MSDETAAASVRQRIVLATDGSDHATTALVTALRLVDPATTAVLLTVIPAADPTVLIGSGHAGPVMTPSEKEGLLAAWEEQAQEILATTSTALADAAPGISVQTEIRSGDPGEEICRAALDHGAAAVVVGTRGQGRLKRALLGSVSDHVVRNASCPVITINLHT